MCTFLTNSFFWFWKLWIELSLQKKFYLSYFFLIHFKNPFLAGLLLDEGAFDVQEAICLLLKHIIQFLSDECLPNSETLRKDVNDYYIRSKSYTYNDWHSFICCKQRLLRFIKLHILWFFQKSITRLLLNRSTEYFLFYYSL